MMRSCFPVRILCIVCACESSSALAGEVPERSASGQTLCVPQEQQTLGEVYYVIPGVGTQLTWETDAPLLRLLATCSRVVGYFVAPFELDEGRPPLLAGALRVPVASLSTGYELFDATLQGPDNFNREQHREILFSLVSAGAAKDVVKKNNREQCTFDLAGEFTIEGSKKAPPPDPANTRRRRVRSFSWAHPSISGGRLYLRYDDNLYCFDVRSRGE